MKGMRMLMVMVLVLFVAAFGAMGQKDSISVLAEDHWAPTFNDVFKAIVADWAAAKGIEAHVDFISSRVAPAKMAAEAEAKKGHDVVYLYRFDPALYENALTPLDDIAQTLESEYGPWRDAGRYLCYVDGHWYGIPFFTYTWAANINKSAWLKIGLTADDVNNLTWQDFLSKAKELYSDGHPVAAAISQDYDSDGFLYPLLWSFGGKLVDEHGQIVANSQATREMFKYVKQLSQYMPQEVLGWSGADNNMFMLSGKGSWTINPPTIYATAKVKGLPIANDIVHVEPPIGPAGQFVATWDIALGVWNFSPHQELAKDLISFLLQKDNFKKLAEASMGCNQPYLNGLAEYCSSIWSSNESLKRLEPLPPTAHPFMWPAPPSSGAAMAVELHLLPVAVGKYVSGEATLDEAIQWLVFQLRRVGFK